MDREEMEVERSSLQVKKKWNYGIHTFT